jgi:hypothetical protein
MARFSASFFAFFESIGGRFGSLSWEMMDDAFDGVRLSGFCSNVEA